MALRILHTADWHIGKNLYKHNLLEDHSMFFDWLSNTVSYESIDVLIVSGDVFDQANPTNQASEQYFAILKELFRKQIHIIVVGGNHDGVQYLNAPRSVLKELDIDVIGGAEEDLSKEVIELKNKTGEIVCIVAAVPYLRDKDVRKFSSGQLHADRIDEIKYGIKKHYTDVYEFILHKYGDSIPVIATGHLYVQGAETSESEREIQVGNLAGVEAEMFSDMFHYVALGHIHRPQSFKNGKVQYSGSPIQLSFSEKKDIKRCVLIEIDENHNLTWKSIKIPLFRALLNIEGNLFEVKEKLNNIKYTEPLPPLVEIKVLEESFNPTVKQEFMMLSSEPRQFILAKAMISYTNVSNNLSQITNDITTLSDMNPRQVFIDKLSKDVNNDADKDLLLEAFDELLAEYYESLSTNSSMS
jgi:exonuclease SbcD